MTTSNGFHADLRPQLPPEIVMNAGALRAIRRPASGYAFAALGSKNEPAFNHVRNHGHALGMLQYFFRNRADRVRHRSSGALCSWRCFRSND